MTTPSPLLLLARAAQAENPQRFTVLGDEPGVGAIAAFVAAATPAVVAALCVQLSEAEADRDNFRNGHCTGTIGDGFVACGEGGNYCSVACEQAARISALEAGLKEACELIDELTEDTPQRAHAVRGRDLRALAEGRP